MTIRFPKTRKPSCIIKAANNGIRDAKDIYYTLLINDDGPEVVKIRKILNSAYPLSSYLPTIMEKQSFTVCKEENSIEQIEDFPLSATKMGEILHKITIDYGKIIVGNPCDKVQLTANSSDVYSLIMELIKNFKIWMNKGTVTDYEKHSKSYEA